MGDLPCASLSSVLCLTPAFQLPKLRPLSPLTFAPSISSVPPILLQSLLTFQVTSFLQRSLSDTLCCPVTSAF